jgi:flagellar hook-associated protein FlgK
MKVLSEDPVEGAPRTLLQTAAKDLVQQVNSIYDGLISLQESQNQSVEVTVTRINQIADEIQH